MTQPPPSVSPLHTRYFRLAPTQIRLILRAVAELVRARSDAEALAQVKRIRELWQEAA